MTRIRLPLVLWMMLLALMPIGMSASGETPTPVAVYDETGFIASGSRTFRSTGPRAYGVNSMAFHVYVCDFLCSARQVMQEVVSNIPNLETSETGKFQQASVGEIGDEAQAFLAVADSDDFDAYHGIVVWREGAQVYVGYAFAVGRDPFQELFSIGRTITGRSYQDTPMTTPASGIAPSTGGVWDLLPSLSDIPEGFVFVEDKDLGTTGKATPTP